MKIFSYGRLFIIYIIIKKLYIINMSNTVLEIMSAVALRQYALNYLWNCGFVAAYVKKLMFPSDIDDYYEDYLQECWLVILEQKDDVFLKLYNSAIEKGKDYEYELRNYFSIVIRNVVKSGSSNAYRKLKRHSITELRKNDCQWKIYSNSIADPKTITQQISDMND